MKKIFLAFALIASPAFAFQEGVYECDISAFVKMRVSITAVSIAPGIRLPYIESNYYQSGVTHKTKGIAHIDFQTTEKRDRASGKNVVTTRELLQFPDSTNEIISFSSDGKVADNCKKKTEAPANNPDAETAKSAE